MSNKLKKYQEEIENEWMGLGNTTKIRVANPFDYRTREEIENPHIHLLSLMRRPEYFSFTCKHLLNKTVPPIQLAILHELWFRSFPMLIGSRGMGKSFLLALYAMLRATLCQGVKIIVVGAAFRQAKVIFEYCEEIWMNAPILRDICGDSRRNGPRRDVDRCTLRIGDSLIIAIPLGDGSKIRGQRANIIIADEFASIPCEVFENVVSGFAAVSMSPVEKMQQTARLKAMKRLGLRTGNPEDQVAIPGLTSNQTVLSGTAYYAFNHFAAYWKKYKSIIESKGDQHALEELFHGEIPENFDWRDYSVIRIPVNLIPDSFMDKKHVSKAKATIHAAQYLMEYAACFATDSHGFFRRSLVESCVVGKYDNPIAHASCGTVSFNAMLRGNPNRSYVMGVDPASEHDNFSIVILECWDDHRRIVHCWTTTRQRHKDKVKSGLIKEHDFYSYVARKIRDLLILFQIDRVAMDTQGGGVAVMEALHDPEKMRHGEVPIWPIIEEEPKDTDSMPGAHIVELINFAKGDWVAAANHGMRKDFEDKVLLFPEFTAADVGLAHEEDKLMGRIKEKDEGGMQKLYDTLEDCVMEIEDLKDELASIIHTQVGTSMRDRWDTPEVKQQGGKKGRARKDRYSSLLMANAVARSIARAAPMPHYAFTGGFAHDLIKSKSGGGGQKRHHQNPDWYTAAAGKGYGSIVRRM